MSRNCSTRDTVCDDAVVAEANIASCVDHQLPADMSCQQSLTNKQFHNNKNILKQ